MLTSYIFSSKALTVHMVYEFTNHAFELNKLVLNGMIVSALDMDL